MLIPVIGMLFLIQQSSKAQDPDSVFDLTAVIYDELYIPVSATHVINMNTHLGDVTDSLGIFSLPVHLDDTLLVRNIAFRDTLIPVKVVETTRHVRLQRMLYPLLEARVFEWGSSYEDFQEAFKGMPMQQSLAASLDLPRQDPEKVPLEMNEKAVKSAGLLLTSPVSFFYYNFSRHAKSARKLYWLEKDQEKQDLFEAVTGPENLAEITGLQGSELEEFQLFLYPRMQCDRNCPELDLLNEIYGLWELYRELRERGILEEKPEQ
jgi:hypothetical protein